MVDTATITRPAPGWLVGRNFDIGFIFGITLIAVASGVIVVNDPALFPIILMLDIWLLGYHHVISTYTRLCFDRESARQNRFFLIQLPILVAGGCIALAMGIGIWSLATIYLYWQWFHYTRQSWGVSQVYRRKADGCDFESENALKIAFYLVPATGILYRSNQQPESFIGMEVVVLPVADIVVTVFAVATIASLLAFAWSRFGMWRRGRLPFAHTAYMVSHFAVFWVGYILIEDITYGWLVINVWHNAQYVLFVWIFNNRRFNKGVDPKAWFLSSISQTPKWPWYFLVCVGLSTVIYLLLATVTVPLAAIAIPAIVIYQTINFHHYIVDSLIWKASKKPMQKTLGLK